MKLHIYLVVLSLALAGCARLNVVPPGEAPGVGELWSDPIPPDEINSRSGPIASAAVTSPVRQVTPAPLLNLTLPPPEPSASDAARPDAVDGETEEVVLPPRGAPELDMRDTETEVRPADSAASEAAIPTEETASVATDAEVDSQLAVAPVEPTPIGLMDVAARPAEKSLLAGLRAYSDAQYDKASRRFKSALEIGLVSPRDRSAAHKYLAFIHCSSRRFESCEASFRAARAADPTFVLSRSEAGHPMWGPVYKRALP